MASLRIRLLGDFTLTDNNQSSLLTSSQLQTFLSYLLIHRAAPQSRQQLSFVFWPDSTEKQARTNLRHLLHRLRQEWPEVERYVEIERHTIGWRAEADYTLDVARFETQFQRAEETNEEALQLEPLRLAVQAYRGEFLPGCYDEWAVQARAQLQRAFVSALERLVALLEEARALPEAIQYAERLLEHEPFRETTYQALMRLHVASGDRGSALTVYHECVRQLRAELDVEPSASTQTLYRTLVVDGMASDLTLAQTSVLVGREGPWEQLVRVWRDVEVGGVPAQLLVIEGEAGIGKTRLAEELLSSVRRSGALTSASQCYPGHMDLAYAPLARWLHVLPMQHLDDAWLVELARLVPEVLAERPDLRPLGPMTEDWQRQRFYKALRHAFTEHRAAVLLLLDDIQWCDSNTLTWLSYLLQTARRSRLLLVATLRGEEVVDNAALRDLLLSLQQSGQIRRIPLTRLSREDAQRLASSLLGRPVEQDVADDLYSQTEGVPLFIVESIRSVGDGSIAGAHEATPDTVRAILMRRFGQLSRPAQHAASVAAAIGRAFEVDVLLAASELSEDALLSALDELWARQFLRESGRRQYDFAHGKLREAAYEMLSPSRRWAVHLRIAQALERAREQDLDPVSGQLARHYELAGEEQQAASYYQRAAAAARRVYAQEEAREHLERAIELAPSVLDYRLELGDVLVTLGRAEEATSVYHAALEAIASAPIERARLYLKISQALLSQRRYPETAAALDKALQTLGLPAEDDLEGWRLLLHIRLQQAEYLYFTARLEELRAVLSEVGELTILYGNARDEAQHYHMLAFLELRQRRLVATPVTIDYIKKAIAIWEEIGDAQSIAYGQFALGFQYLWVDQLENAEGCLRTACSASRRVGNAFVENLAICYLSVTLRKLGEIEAVRETTDELLRLSTRLGGLDYQGVAQAHLAWLAYVDARFDETARKAHHALGLMQHAYPLEWLARFPLLALAVRDGELEAACNEAHAMLQPEQQKLPDDLESAMHMALAAGESPEAEQLWQDVLSLAQKRRFL